MNVLVTGACGWTASAINDALVQAGYNVIGFDLPAACGTKGIKNKLITLFPGTISSLADVCNVTKSADIIIHLAIATGQSNYQSPEVPFNVNVLGTYNIFEAARRNKVSKIILIGSAAVHVPLDKHKLDALKDWKSSKDNDHLYDLTKRLQEEIAKDFCETHAMSAIVLRSGHIVDGKEEVDPDGHPLSELAYSKGGWVCRYDLASACLRAINMPNFGYNSFHIVGSRQAEEYFDIERSERELGLIFKYCFDKYR